MKPKKKRQPCFDSKRKRGIAFPPKVFVSFMFSPMFSYRWRAPDGPEDADAHLKRHGEQVNTRKAACRVKEAPRFRVTGTKKLGAFKVSVLRPFIQANGERKDTQINTGCTPLMAASRSARKYQALTSTACFHLAD